MRHRLLPFILMTLLSPMSIGASSQLQQDINSLNKTIQEKTQSRDSFSENNQANEIEKRELNSDILSTEIEIKQLNRERHKIIALSDNKPSQTDKTRIHTITYKLRVAEINLQKKQALLKSVQVEQSSSAQRVERLNKLISEMESEMLILKKSSKSEAIAQANQQKLRKEKERLNKRRKQQIKEKRLQEVALAAKQEAKQEALVKAKNIAKKKEDNQRNQVALLEKLPNSSKIAFFKTKSIAKKRSKNEPSLGQSPILQVANPIGSQPEEAAKMQHLGNHQYMATIKANAGKQHYLIEGFKFTQSVPKHFNETYYLVLIDARKARPSFKMLTTGK